MFCFCLVINVSVQYNGGLLPDIMLLTQPARSTIDMLFVVRRLLSIGTGLTEENPDVHVLRRPPEGLRLGRPRSVVEGAGPDRRTIRDDRRPPPIP